jgi:hypothetical protein
MPQPPFSDRKLSRWRCAAADSPAKMGSRKPGGADQPWPRNTVAHREQLLTPGIRASPVVGCHAGGASK